MRYSNLTEWTEKLTVPRLDISRSFARECSLGYRHLRLYRHRPRLPPFRSLTRSLPLTPSAIGGGGFIPARIARSFLKTGTGQGKRNIPIQAIGLSLYEALPDVSGGSGRANVDSRRKGSAAG